MITASLRAIAAAAAILAATGVHPLKKRPPRSRRCPRLLGRAGPRTRAALQRDLECRSSIGRIGEPSEIAAVIVFLLY
jgi:hypothetical protein